MKENMKTHNKVSEYQKSQMAGNKTSTSGPLAGVGICVIGGGFVGLVTAAGFAQFGHSVICVENDPTRLEALQKGEIPFYEKDLNGLIQQNREIGRLTFSSDLKSAIKGQKAIFIAVGTPSSSDGRADLSALTGVAEAIKEVIEPGQIIVLKSTVPVGTGKKIQAIFTESGFGPDKVAVVNCPEFLREGSAVADFFSPQRIVLGGQDSIAVELVAHIYRLGMTQPIPIVKTNNETAEMIKYASNAFLTTKIGFVNELAGLCDHVGINVLEVVQAMGFDRRIGAEFMEPGPGWGGSCFGKDIRELIGLAELSGFPMRITRAVLEANRQQNDLVVEKIRNSVGLLNGAVIGVLGLAFKADTSDMRESPAIPIIEKLRKEGAIVKAFDPQANGESENYLPGLDKVESAEEVARDADCLVILTEWREFQMLDYRSLARMMRRANMVDARNILTPELAKKYGFDYQSMGQV